MLPEQIITCPGRIELHASRSYSQRVTEPSMGRFLTDNVRQVRQPGRRLEGERLPSGKLAMEVRR